MLQNVHITRIYAKKVLVRECSLEEFMDKLWTEYQGYNSFHLITKMNSLLQSEI